MEGESNAIQTNPEGPRIHGLKVANWIENTVQMRPDFIPPESAKKIECADQEISTIEQKKVSM